MKIGRAGSLSIRSPTHQLIKTTINGKEIKILVDPGGDRTIISPSLLKKVATKHERSTPLNINTITGKKKSIQAHIYIL